MNNKNLTHYKFVQLWLEVIPSSWKETGNNQWDKHIEQLIPFVETSLKKQVAKKLTNY